MPTKTIRRDWLKRQIELGRIEAKCNYHLTDDYAYDNATGFGRTDWLKCRISNPTWKEITTYLGETHTVRDDPDFIEGMMNLHDHDFTGKCGSAWWDDGSTITLVVHSNLSYDMRLVA